MSAAVLKVLKLAKALSPDEQKELIDSLQEKYPTDEELGLEPGFMDSVRRLSADYDAGKVKTIPWSEVRQSLIEELKNDQ